MGTPSPACCFSFYLLCPVLSGVLCGKFHYSCDVKQRLLQPSCSLYSFSAFVYHKEHGIGKVLARSSWCFSQCQMYFSLFHFCLDCSLFKAESSLPVSGPWGHQYLVAVTSHHPHIFCPVIQELYFRLCLWGCLCPHLHWTCLVSQPTSQSCFHSFLCPWPLPAPSCFTKKHLLENIQTSRHLNKNYMAVRKSPANSSIVWAAFLSTYTLSQTSCH